MEKLIRKISSSTEVQNGELILIGTVRFSGQTGKQLQKEEE